MKKYVAVAGTIGAGKTSLVRWLETNYGLEAFYEPNEGNPYLADFYADMKRWAFHSQTYFLAYKLDLHQTLERAGRAGRAAVIDRTIYEDAEIFAKSLRRQKFIDDRDWAVYWRLYEGIVRSLKPPDVLIAVSCSLSATKKRIKKRARAMEADIPDAYLRGVHRAYESWFQRYDHSPIVSIDTTKMDYVEDLIDLIELKKTIDRALKA